MVEFNPITSIECANCESRNVTITQYEYASNSFECRDCGNDDEMMFVEV